VTLAVLMLMIDHVVNPIINERATPIKTTT
jgi:hypothetical protein